MSGCCSASTKTPTAKHVCPANGKSYKRVSSRTVTHHTKEPWNLVTEGKTFYFCDDSECAVTYFADDDSVITASDLRTIVGIKDRKNESPICYCYGVTFGAYDKDPSLKDYVTEQTKLGQCSCETSNPSGKCCLKDFPKSLIV